MSRIIDEYGRPKFDLDEFDICLKKLAEKMEERDIEPFDIYAIGGLVCLVKGKRDFTHDIDAFYNPSTALEKAIYDVSEEVQNREWLNNAVESHRSGNINNEVPSLDDLLSIGGAFELYQKIGRINLFVANSFVIIYMKLIAMRDSNTGRPDKTDPQDIIDLTSDYTPERVLEEIKKFEPIINNSMAYEDYISNYLYALRMGNIINDNEYIELAKKYLPGFEL